MARTGPLSCDINGEWGSEPAVCPRLTAQALLLEAGVGFPSATGEAPTTPVAWPHAGYLSSSLFTPRAGLEGGYQGCHSSQETAFWVLMTHGVLAAPCSCEEFRGNPRKAADLSLSYRVGGRGPNW